MTAKPALGITCCVREVEGESAQTVISRYVRAVVRHADVAALLIPAIPDLIDVRDIAGRIDGLLLTGSPSNVAPACYGHSDVEETGPSDPARDSTSLPLIETMIGRGLPVFGICRGHQELNVALGGTLRRDLADHHAPEGVSRAEMFGHSHEVELTAGGLLRHMLGRDRILVNSVHYQAIDRLASGLTAEAYSPDGIIEAVSGRLNGAPLLGVQWHPEWDADSNETSHTLLAMIGRALRGEDIFA